MKPSAPKTERLPSTRLRKALFGGSHCQYQDPFRRSLIPNKQTLISVFILWLFFMPVGKGIAQLNTGAWPMRGHDARHTGQSEYTEKAFGVLKWRYQLGGSDTYSSPAIAIGGTVYVASSQGNVYALNPNGTLKWNYPTGSYTGSSPAIAANGTIYVGSGDRYLYAINPDGTLKWRYLTGGAIGSSPAIAIDGTVYVGSSPSLRVISRVPRN